jgi:hypothetical protein
LNWNAFRKRRPSQRSYCGRMRMIVERGTNSVSPAIETHPAFSPRPLHSQHRGDLEVTILLRLFLLVAAALLPAIAVQAYNEFDLRRARQIEVQNQALGLAKLAAAEQQQIVQGIRQTLVALSQLPAIRAKDT